MPLDAIVLLGWMERDFALQYLLNDCIFDPPLNQEQAGALWQQYRDRVEALPERDANAPAKLELTREEQDAAERFLAPHRASGSTAIRDVIKVDPMGLVVYQLYVVVEKAREYMNHAAARTWCARNCLAVRPRRPQQFQGRSRLNVADIQIPHGEFAAAFIPPDKFSVEELAGHVSVTEFGMRMLLWAGYHRSYARMASMNPDATDRSLLAVLTNDADFVLSPDSPNQGVRAMVCGLRPPIFADFFDNRLFMSVRLRRKRYELRIRAMVVGINCEP
jgi:hypothetical protein